MGRRVRDVMTQEVVTVNEHASFKQVAMLIAERRVSAVPVLDREGRVLGVVSEADLVLKEEYPEGPPEARMFQGRRRRIAQAKAAGDTAAELMTAPAVTIGPDASVAEAARLLHRHAFGGVGQLVVAADADHPGTEDRSDVHLASPHLDVCPHLPPTLDGGARTSQSPVA